MTANQIAYEKLREEKRYHDLDITTRAQANQISAQTAAANELNAYVNMQNARTREREADIAQQRVYNEQQQIQQNYLLESARISEEARHNTIVEAETGRHNQEVEQETWRHNIYDEGIQHAQIQSAEKRTWVQTLGNVTGGVINAAAKLVGIFA